LASSKYLLSSGDFGNPETIRRNSSPKQGFLSRLIQNSLGERTRFFGFDESNPYSKSFYPLPSGERVGVRGVGAQFIEPALLMPNERMGPLQ